MGLEVVIYGFLFIARGSPAGKPRPLVPKGLLDVETAGTSTPGKTGNCPFGLGEPDDPAGAASETSGHPPLPRDARAECPVTGPESRSWS